jgi:DNA-binding MarR family transcriptional regulator
MKSDLEMEVSTIDTIVIPKPEMVQQTTPELSPGGTKSSWVGLSCACEALRRSSRAVTQFYDLVLAPSGLKATQFISLRAIDEAGEIAQHQFARQYAVAVETLSRRLGALRRKELVKVRTGCKHGEQLYSLTEKGKAILNHARPYWDRAEDRLKTTLGDNEWRLILILADRVVLAAAAAEELRIRNHDQRTAA